MPTLEKSAPQKTSIQRPGFKRFMHEWEEKLHHTLETNGHNHDQGPPPTPAPERARKKAA